MKTKSTKLISSFKIIGVLKIMIRTFIFLCCIMSFGLSPKKGFTQNEKIRIEKSKVFTVPEVLQLIIDQTDYSFVYAKDLFETANTIPLKKGIIPADKLLDKCLESTNFTYNLTNDKTIILVKKNKLKQQKQKIKGTITDNDNVPLPGVNVLIKGTNTGTTTDFDGKYEIAVNKGDVLVFSFLGYLNQEIPAPINGDVLDVVLQQSVSNLDEVVIVGYGNTVRKDLTGSVSSIKSEQVRQIKTQTIDQALVGQMAGVFVESNAGAPGAGASVNIRGLSQIIGDNQPLYVVDGVPIVVNPNFGTGQGAGNRGNPLLAIDPSSIERVDVLKDASSAAIYGSRAANGVVLITTKKGKKNQAPRFNFTYNTTFLEPTRELDFFNAEEYRNFATEFAQRTLDNTTLPPFFLPFFFPTELEIVNNPDDFFGDADTDWQDLITDDTAFWNQYNFDVSGGTDKTSYLLGASVSDQDGVFVGQRFQRYGINASVDSQVKDNFKVGASINYNYTVNKQSAITSLILGNFRPDIGLFDEDGNPSSVPSGIFGFNFDFPNPLDDSGKVRFETISQNIFGSLYGELGLLKHLKFKSQISVSVNNDENSMFFPSFTVIGFFRSSGAGLTTPSGILTTQDTNGYTTTFTNTLNYNNTIGKNHAIDALFGVSWDRSFLNIETDTFGGFPDDENLINPGSATTQIDFSDSSIEFGLNSIFGRLQYNYDNRYLATVTLRSDGSTKFGPGNQRGFFPSLGVAWNLHNEDFLGDNSTISQLKLRASLGRTGTDNLPPFAFLPLLITGNEDLNLTHAGNNGAAVIDLPNRNIKWESTDQLDIGLEFGLFGNRINGEIVYFEKNTDDLILFVPVPGQTGSLNFSSNAADVSNKGWEFTIGANIINTKDLTWNSSFNISFVTNKVESLNGGENTRSSGLDGIAEGEPIGFINGFVVESIAASETEIDDLNANAPNGVYFSNLNTPGDYIFRDLNGDNQITDADRTNLGDINPDYFGGWNNTITYKNFDLAFNLQFVQGTSKNWNLPNDLIIPNLQRNQFRDIANQAWTPNNLNARFAAFGSPTHGELNSRTVFDASYVRLRFLEVGYSLPKKLVTKLGVANARLSLGGNNIFTITDYPGQDPENVTPANLNGSSVGRVIDRGSSFPQTRTFTFGFNLSF